MCHFLEIVFDCFHSKRTEAILKCAIPLKCIWYESYWQDPQKETDISKLPVYLFKPKHFEGVTCQKCSEERAIREAEEQMHVDVVQANIEEIQRYIDRLSLETVETCDTASADSPTLPDSEVSLWMWSTNSSVTETKQPDATRSTTQSATPELTDHQSLASVAEEDLDDDLGNDDKESIRYPFLPKYTINNSTATRCASGYCRNPVMVGFNGQVGEFCPDHTCAAAREWGCMNDGYSNEHTLRSKKYCLSHTCSVRGCTQKVMTPDGETCSGHLDDLADCF